MIIEIYLLFKGFLNQLKKDSISAFAAQAAFFLILSITPLCPLLLTLVRFLPITESTVIQALMTVVPPSLEPVISTVIWELFNQGSSTLISISALVHRGEPNRVRPCFFAPFRSGSVTGGLCRTEDCHP